MLTIKINGAPAKLCARARTDGAWDLVCLDPLAGQFWLRSGDTLHLWSSQAGEWLPATEGDLAELAIEEVEKGS